MVTVNRTVFHCCLSRCRRVRRSEEAVMRTIRGMAASVLFVELPQRFSTWKFEMFAALSYQISKSLVNVSFVPRVIALLNAALSLAQQGFRSLGAQLFTGRGGETDLKISHEGQATASTFRATSEKGHLSASSAVVRSRKRTVKLDGFQLPVCGWEAEPDSRHWYCCQGLNIIVMHIIFKQGSNLVAKQF
jgi:hypothetical protein